MSALLSSWKDLFCSKPNRSLQDDRSGLKILELPDNISFA